MLKAEGSELHFVGSCDICTEPVSKVAEPWGLVHKCGSCGAVLCAPCNQISALQRDLVEIKAKVRGPLDEEALLVEAEEKKVKVAQAKLLEVKQEERDFADTALEQFLEAERLRKRLEDALSMERETFGKATSVVKNDLKRREAELDLSRKQMRLLEAEIASAPSRQEQEATAERHMELEEVTFREEIQKAGKSQEATAERCDALRLAMQAAEVAEVQLREETQEVQIEATTSTKANEEELSQIQAELHQVQEQISEMGLRTAHEEKQQQQQQEKQQQAGGFKSGLKRFWGKVQSIAKDLDPLPMEEVRPSQSSTASAGSVNSVGPFAPPVPSRAVANLWLEYHEWQSRTGSLMQDMNVLHDELSTSSAEASHLRSEAVQLRKEEAGAFESSAELQKELGILRKAVDDERAELKTELEAECRDSRQRMLTALGELKRKDSVDPADVKMIIGPQAVGGQGTGAPSGC